MISNLFFKNNRKKVIFFNKKKKLINNSFIVIDGKNKKQFFNAFLSLTNNQIKYDKNFFIFYKFENYIVGNHLFPDWPSKYLNQSFLKNLFLWLKYFFYIFFYYKKIYLFLIKTY